jgi:hypothetical protein
MSLGGIFLLISPVFHDVGFTAGVMAAFLALGGLLASLGVCTHRWVGEFTGLPLLCTSFAVFAILNVTQGDFKEVPWYSLANISILIAVSALIVARWRVAFSFFQLANHPVMRSHVAGECDDC